MVLSLREEILLANRGMMQRGNWLEAEGRWGLARKTGRGLTMVAICCEK